MALMSPGKIRFPGQPLFLRSPLRVLRGVIFELKRASGKPAMDQFVELQRR